MANSKASKAFENLAPLLGLGASIGAQIPGLKKPKKTNTASAAARKASMKSAGAAVGASQTGFGASRGLALRSGLRAGAKHAREGAAGAANAAAMDEANFQSQNDARNTRLAQFGKDVGEVGASIGTGITESRQAAAAEEEAGKAAEMAALQQQAATLLPTYAETTGQDPNTGLQQEQPGMTPQPMQELEVGPGPTLEQTDQYGDSEMDPTAGLTAAPGLEELAMDPALAELGLQNKETLYSIAPELEAQHRLENLALAEAYRTGANINRIYARLRRMQDLPAVGSAIDISRALQYQQGAQQ